MYCFATNLDHCRYFNTFYQNIVNVNIYFLEYIMSLKKYIQNLNKTEALCHKLFLITNNPIIINNKHFKNISFLYLLINYYEDF